MRAAVAALVFAPTLAFAQGWPAVNSPIPAGRQAIGVTSFVATNTALKLVSGADHPNGIVRQGFSAPGDGGRAQYYWSASNCVAADEGYQVQPSVTGCWIADLSGRAVPVEIWGCDGTGLVDAAPCLNRAASALANAGGGTLTLAKRYLVGSVNFTIPLTVTVRGTWARPGLVWGGNYTVVQSALVVNSARTVVVYTGAGIENIMVMREGLLNPGPVGTTAAQSLQQAYAQHAAFAGTGVTLGWGSPDGYGSSSAARNLLILGFQTCLDAGGSNAMDISGVHGDCDNGLKLYRIGEYGTVAHNEFWPFLMFGSPENYYDNGVIAGDVYFYTRTISAIANAAGKIRVTVSAPHDFETGNTVIISGAAANTGANNSATNPMWTVTKISSTQFDLQGSTFTNASGAAGKAYTTVLFREGNGVQLTSHMAIGCDHCALVDNRSFGYKTGFDLVDSDHVRIDGGRADTWFSPLRQDTTGLWVHGAAGKLNASNMALAAQGTLVKYDVPTAIVPHSSLSNVDLWGCVQYAVRMVAGNLTINGGVIDSSPPATLGGAGNCGIQADGGVLHLTGGLQIQNNALTAAGGTIMVGEAYTADGRLSPQSTLLERATFFWDGPITASRTMIFNTGRPVHSYSAMAGSDCRSEANATGTVVLNLFKNASNIGTVTFGAGTGYATLAAAAAVDFVTGDRFKIVAPASPDATLANVSCTFAFAPR